MSWLSFATYRAGLSGHPEPSLSRSPAGCNGSAAPEALLITTVLAVCGVVLMHDLFDGRLSWDGVIAALGILGAIGVTVWRWYRKRHPLSGKFSDQPFDFPGERTTRCCLRLQPGDHDILVWVRPYIRIQFQEINISLVESSWWPAPWGLAPALKETVMVLACDDPDLRRKGDITGEGFTSWDDGTGGRFARYIPKKDCPSGGSMWLGVKIKAARPWRGFLSIQNREANDYRHACRLPMMISAEHPREA